MSGHQHSLIALGEPGLFGKDSWDSSAGLALAIQKHSPHLVKVWASACKNQVTPGRNAPPSCE